MQTLGVDYYKAGERNSGCTDIVSHIPMLCELPELLALTKERHLTLIVDNFADNDGQY